MILSTALTNLKTAVIMSPYVLDGFNSGLAQSTAKKYIDPITTFLMWVVPLVAVIVCLISFVKWFVMDEDEKERHKPFRMIKKIIIVTIIAELITTLFKIFGLQ